MMMMMGARDLDVALVTAAGVATPQGNNLLTVADATTYYAELGGGSESDLAGHQWCWGSLLVAAITYESTNLPMSDAATFVAAGALWFPESAAGTLLVPGGSASTQVHHFADFGARRMRAKIVVTTGGTAQLRGRSHYKAG